MDQGKHADFERRKSGGSEILNQKLSKKKVYASMHLYAGSIAGSPACKSHPGEPSAENPGKGVEFSTRCLPNCCARRGAGNKKYVWELEGRGVPRTKDTQDFANCALGSGGCQTWRRGACQNVANLGAWRSGKCRKSEQGCRVLLRTAGSLA